jgi:hypothetical protein
MSLPTKAEVYSSLMEHLRLAQEDAAKLAHLTVDESPLNSQGWLVISELFRGIQSKVITLATKVMH